MAPRVYRKQPTYRMQNMCWNCWYTWYPRGHNFSLRCPNCGSSQTGPDLTALLAVLGLFGIILAVMYWYVVLPACIFLFFLSKIAK